MYESGASIGYPEKGVGGGGSKVYGGILRFISPKRSTSPKPRP